MEPSHNPYAPSRATLEAGSARTGAQLWRLNKVLIMTRDGDLPERCVKCNDTAEEPVKMRKVYWHHPGIYALLLINIILYVIVAMIARKTAKLSPGLCAVHKQKRARSIWFGWGSLVVGFALMVGAIGAQNPGIALLLMFVTLGCIIASMIMSRIVYAKRIDDTYIQLKGCGDGFLADLPEFHPGTRNR